MCVIDTTRTETDTCKRAKMFVCNAVLFILLASTTTYCSSLPGILDCWLHSVLITVYKFLLRDAILARYMRVSACWVSACSCVCHVRYCFKTAKLRMPQIMLRWPWDFSFLPTTLWVMSVHSICHEVIKFNNLINPRHSLCKVTCVLIFECVVYQ